MVRIARPWTGRSSNGEFFDLLRKRDPARQAKQLGRPRGHHRQHL
jgi:hypothetical protein